MLLKFGNYVITNGTFDSLICYKEQNIYNFCIYIVNTEFNIEWEYLYVKTLNMNEIMNETNVWISYSHLCLAQQLIEIMKMGIRNLVSHLRVNNKYLVSFVNSVSEIRIIKYSPQKKKNTLLECIIRNSLLENYEAYI